MDGRCPNFSLRLCLRTRGELMLTNLNFGLKIRPFWDSDHENWYRILTFIENKRLFARITYIRLLIYLKAIYGQKMKEIDLSTLTTRWSIFLDRRSLKILPSKMSNEPKLLLSWQPIPLFLIISVRRASLLSWKYLLVEEKESFCSWKVSRRTRGKLMLANLRLKIRAVWDSNIENQSSKFLTNKWLLAGTAYIRFLIYLKAIYMNKKMKEIYFSN